MSKMKKRCKYCEAGNKPNNGEHWIVKSISPAAIKIVKCSHAALIEGEK